eukprot:TRINITY_DN16958_c0_g1_i1.p1 TRINITY_DN16958_c0_g1~~TRINITY_DN16958_c0_g1_i1.p1  ORF type:complete len:148 (+),score=32.36 TRINITY_DN16958_c0_g1_i1:31-474(+)
MEGVLVDEVVDALFGEIEEQVVEEVLGDAETCVICFEEVLAECMETTECNHRFCKRCLGKIRESKPFCPLCRTRIGSDPPSLAHIEDHILHLLLRLLSVSSMLHSPHLVTDTRHVLLDIILGTHEEEGGDPDDQHRAQETIVIASVL